MEMVVIIFVVAFVLGLIAAAQNGKLVKAVKQRVQSTYKIDEIYVSAQDLSLIGISFDDHKIILGIRKYDVAYDFSQIVSVDLVENGTTVTQTNRGSQLLSAAVGGVAFGGVGAVVGGLSGSSRSRERLRGISLKVTIDDRVHPVHTICFLRSSNKKGVDPDGFLAKLARNNVEHFHAHVLNAMRQAQAKPVIAPPTFAPEGLQKLWDMKQMGILTEDEFVEQKARLLGQQGKSKSDSGMMPPQHPSSRGAARYCNKCGSTLMAGARFCSSCGSTVKTQ